MQAAVDFERYFPGTMNLPAAQPVQEVAAGVGE
jgi:hypothetical protein